MKAKVVNGGILLLASAIGIVAFVAPFVSENVDRVAVAQSAHAQDAPVMTLLLVTLCLAATMASLSSGEMNSKTVAILGVLTAANAVLRAVPGPAGFAALFMLPVLCGYVYGATFGFLLGATSLLVSALLGGGIGPWLPYQMFTAGWVGLTSAWLPRIVSRPRAEVVMLAVWGALWGLVYGAVMNLWFWPYVFQGAGSEMYWERGLGLGQAAQRYLVFYGVTSLWWDLGRAVGNLVLIAVFGQAILRLLRRFQKRFHFEAVTIADLADERA